MKRHLLHENSMVLVRVKRVKYSDFDNAVSMVRRLGQGHGWENGS